MITFSTYDKQDIRFTKIPPQISSRISFLMYCNDSIVGSTYGSACKRVIVKTKDGKSYCFSVDMLKKFMKRNITASELLKLGTEIKG